MAHTVPGVRAHSYLLTRRGVLFLAAQTALPRPVRPHQPDSHQRLAVEGYIWQQYAQRLKQPLGTVLDQIFPMAKEAGYHDVELNQDYFAPDWRDRVLALLRSNGLSMPSVYVGGVMHEPDQARQTVERALRIAAICQPFGCKAVVHNPSPKAGSAPKTADELKLQSEALNGMGRTLAASGFQLRVHHHTPEMMDNAREWRYILRTTNANDVTLCMDLDWVHQGGQDPLGLLREAGARVTEIHLRNSIGKLWLEALGDGDIDYRPVAEYLKTAHLDPLLVVELAYREQTAVTRPLGQDLRRSRLYAEKMFGVKA